MPETDNSSLHESKEDLNIGHHSVGILVSCFQFVRSLRVRKRGKLTGVISQVGQ